MERNEIRDRIIKAFRQRVPRAKLPDPEQLRVEPGRGVRLCLTTQAVKKNMQEDSAAFVNSTPIVRQYGILLTNGVLFYAKRETK